MESVLVHQLTECFHKCHKEQFTGKIYAYTQTGQQWPIYFLMGNLIWANGGSHRFRRWFRLLEKYLSYIDFKQIPDPNLSSTHLWEYGILSSLIQQKKTLKSPISNLINETINEILFEILQEATGIQKLSQVSENTQKIKKIENPISTLFPDESLQVALSEWNRWQQVGLISYSPNFSPSLKYPDSLKQKIPEPSYSKLSKLLTGEKSLREISVQLKVPPLSISKSLLPFVYQGIVSLSPVPDWTPIDSLESMESDLLDHSPISLSKVNSPLILCIDDSPMVCQALEKIITASGYRFISVQEPLQALTTMLEHKPDFIFLDLVMPIASGYEICSQIRRISSFQSTPVVILTGKDGMIDRVRAKLVGASDFLSKPIQPHKVLRAVDRYLSIKSSVCSSYGDRNDSIDVG